VFLGGSQVASVVPRKLVTALEILRFYADAFANAGYNLALEIRKFSKDPSSHYDPMVMKVLRMHLGKLSTDCAELPVTSVKVKRILAVLDDPQMMAILPSESIPKMLTDIQVGIEDELSTKLFFQLRPERAKMFNDPTDGWAEVLDKFHEARMDVEEMHKCYALSRYAGSVFHSVQTIECALLDLGTFLEVEDLKSGWTAVSNKLEKLTKMKFQDLSDKHQKNFAFIEQMQATVVALQRAWRNKISHAHGKLTLLTSEFAPDVAEEILMATRAFMRRLAGEIPK